MKIVSVAKSSIYSTSTTRTQLNAADMCTIAKNNVLFNDSTHLNLYIGAECQGVSTYISSATSMGGTGTAVSEMNPGFYPYATAGSECAAVVKSLDWANNNLGEDYEYITVTGAYLVSGTLTSSKTEFNDPFEIGSGLDFVGGGCWASAHAIGLNPF